jgi:hypothetical protein
MSTVHDFGPFNETLYRTLQGFLLEWQAFHWSGYRLDDAEICEVILPLMAAYERGDLRMGETTADDVAVRP